MNETRDFLEILGDSFEVGYEEIVIDTEMAIWLKKFSFSNNSSERGAKGGR